jgi:hypothetical protein
MLSIRIIFSEGKSCDTISLTQGSQICQQKLYVFVSLCLLSMYVLSTSCLRGRIEGSGVGGGGGGEVIDSRVVLKKPNHTSKLFTFCKDTVCFHEEIVV